MMRTFQQRVLVSLAAAILSAVCGSFVGHVAGRELATRMAWKQLNEYAASMGSISDNAIGEGREILNAINSSPLAYCSDGLLQQTRLLIFRSHQIKDAGGMKEGKIGCSAVMGRLSEPLPQPKPEFTRPDGARMYPDLEIFKVSGQSAITVQVGDAFVVYSPFLQGELGSASMHFSATTLDVDTGRIGRFLGDISGADATILSTDGRAMMDGTLYSTRCSPRYFNCMTAFISIPEIMQKQHLPIAAITIAGAMVGGWCGFMLSLLYKRSLTLEKQLRRAIASDSLKLVYQPLVKMKSRQIVGAEALARWSDEDGNPVGPDVFIKIAEEVGFVSQITRLVVRHALRDFGETLRAHPEFHLSINVAAADLADEGFVPMLSEALSQHGVSAKSIVIEITEGSTARNEVAAARICQLRIMGFAVHIDDFGTGYSSLSYLHALSVDAIKIDKSFTQAIGTDAVTVSILPQIMLMADALNLMVVVEGIETEEQAAYFDCVEQPVLGQGWLFGRPVPAEQFQLQLTRCQAESLALELDVA